jgi:antirestriction protein ArdC
MNREEALEMTDRGVQELIAALEQGKSEQLLEYLAFQARFHQYSFSNCLLIALQKSDATFVAGFQRWRQLGRFVKKGEKGILILAPLVRRQKSAESTSAEASENGRPRAVIGFRAAYVFDVSQTDGAELPEFSSISGDPGERLDHLKELVGARGVELRYEECLGGAQGVSQGGKIAILLGLSPSEEFAVLVHELAHELLHRTDRRKETTARVRELEAEAVAFVVTRAAGLDSLVRSSDYIQLYGGDKELFLASLSHIQRVASDLIGALLTRSAVTETAN